MSVLFVVFVGVCLLLLLGAPVVQWRLGQAGQTLVQSQKAFFSTFKTPDYLALAISAMYLGLMSTAAVGKALDARPPVWLVQVILVALLVALVALCITDTVIARMLKRHKPWLYASLGILGAGISYVAGPLADAAISEFTHVEASAFARSQTTFNFIMSLLLWPLAMSVVAAVIYLPLAVWVMGGSLNARSKKLRYHGAWLKQVEIRKQSFATFRQFSIVLVVSLYLILIPETVANLAGGPGFDRFMKKVLVFSSYHLPPRSCGLTDEAFKDAKVVALRFKRASVAVPDGQGSYRFSVEPCVLEGTAAVK